jgi:pancreatic triacylglycerol lipase
VDSIHTDGTPTLNVGLGIFQSVGHVDYYPNGGINQPNCPQTSDKILNAIFSIATLDVRKRLN